MFAAFDGLRVHDARMDSSDSESRGIPGPVMMNKLLVRATETNENRHDEIDSRDPYWNGRQPGQSGPLCHCAT